MMRKIRILTSVTMLVPASVHLLCTRAALQAMERPNIVLAMADDQGWRDVAYNAKPDRGLQTPHLDRMAREGIRFNRFYSSSPNCSPTRAGVLTGRHCHRSGVFNPGFAMRPEELTIAEILKKAGYATAHFGKWHMGPVKAHSPFNPRAHGFDYYVSHDNFFETDPQLSRNGNAPETFSGDGSEVIVEEALKYIDSIHNTGKPFLVVIWFGSPHKPHKPLQKDKDLYSHLPEEWQNYFGEITGMDRAMGNLRSGLKNRGLDANTLIWYTSDNGSHKPADHITGLRGHKGEMWEGGLRVPAIIVWPKEITKPIETEMVASTLDIMPTILDLLDITPKNDKFDGISLAPLIQGAPMAKRSTPMPFWRVGKFAREARNNKSDFTEAQLHGWWRDFACPKYSAARTEGFGGWAAWVEGQWKLHKMNNGQYELYDLQEDPAETTDLASRMPEKVEELAGRLLDWQRSAEKSLAGADSAAEPVLNER
jgi:arylsulfatase A-like enzyme